MTAKRFRRGDRLKVTIERLSIGGRGVARAEGLVIFIPAVLPQEEVEIELTLVKKNFAEARAISLLQQSSMRIHPPCPVIEKCGGCNWQHISYEEQLRQKRELVTEALRKFSGYNIGEGVVAEVLASPKPFRYRNRIQLHHSGPRLGFHKRGSHELIDIDDCLITEEPLAEEIPRLKKQLAHEKAGRIELYLSADGKPCVRKPSRENGNSEPEEAAFSQVNTGQNQNLIKAVLETFTTILVNSKVHRIYDLYAGSGNFSLPLAQAHSEIPITAVELSQESVDRARSLLETLPSQQLRFECKDVEAFLHSEQPQADDVVVLDPPRTGCSPNVIRLLGEASPKHIIYISCHPVTLARDLGLLRTHGYRLKTIRPFDMFPQTDHVETIAHLERAPAPQD